MCGIAGFYDETLSIGKKRELLDLSLKSISHRGPDGDGVFFEGPIALGHKRLSIIDLASGAQPLISSDDKYVITFNGEIYNYRDLKKDLEREGCVFRTHSDTEVILNGYKVWGKQVSQKLNGMFSFLIYDRQENSFFAARDPFGQKPFFYFWDQSRFYFGSEARIFKEWKHLPISISASAITHFLSYESFYGDQTIYQNVKKLKPGHHLHFQGGKVSIEPFFFSCPSNFKVDEAEAVDELDRLLLNSVKRTFEADVPVGLLLSGGLDSSLVCAYAKDLFPERPFTAFHIANQSRSFNESHYAVKVADQFNLKLNKIDLDLVQLSELAQSLPGQFDEPMADPGVLPKYLVSREIRKEFKVALTGDGGDELFYGYLIMKAEKFAQIYKKVPAWIHEKCIQKGAQLVPSSTNYMNVGFLLRNFLKGFPSEDAFRSVKWMVSFSDADLKGLLLNLDETTLADSLREVQEIYDLPKESTYMGKFAYRLQKTYLPDYVLANSDRTSMLNSLELRTPLLDVQLASFVNSLSDDLKMPGLQLKYLMKKVAERRLPKDVIYRKKMGFTVPIGELLRSELRKDFEETFDESKIRRQGFFRSSMIQDIWRRHQGGRENLYKPLWTLYSLQKWLDKNL